MLLFYTFFQDFWSFFKSGFSVGKLFRYTIGCCRFENMDVHILTIILERMQSKRPIAYQVFSMFQNNWAPAVNRQPGFRRGRLVELPGLILNFLRFWKFWVFQFFSISKHVWWRFLMGAFRRVSKSGVLACVTDSRLQWNF